ncbi:uncharacterized protein PAC_16611 [Phialocephala subalpina]|uniref:Uncharacterized protein n=1 Tax=Phialocephala subalpina TaxID=576137 RepID=A0A1L7XNS0_9HELO|nr:uncharacterized protein PAC_16611 [Phialocephala subalpina]
MRLRSREDPSSIHTTECHRDDSKQDLSVFALYWQLSQTLICKTHAHTFHPLQDTLHKHLHTNAFRRFLPRSHIITLYRHNRTVLLGGSRLDNPLSQASSHTKATFFSILQLSPEIRVIMPTLFFSRFRIEKTPSPTPMGRGVATLYSSLAVSPAFSSEGQAKSGRPAASPPWLDLATLFSLGFRSPERAGTTALHGRFVDVFNSVSGDKWTFEAHPA